MKKIVFSLALVLVLVLNVFGTASAVTDGELDGDNHPYVGVMVAQLEDGTPLWRCSGTLVSPTLFVTAGHCTEDPAVRAEIWFDADVTAGRPGNGYPFTGDVSGTTYTHPDFYSAPFFMNDLGVVVLDEPVVMDEYGVLPELGVLNSLTTKRGKQDVSFTAVGYGLQMSYPDAAAWKEDNKIVRMVATPHLIQINGGIIGDYGLLLSNNAATGGTCFGDSGGPNFIGDSNVLAGVTSFGMNGNCAGTGGVYRLDTESAQDWLYSEFGEHLP